MSSSAAFCFHANGSENFNGVRITPLVRAPSDLRFVRAASRSQLCGASLTHLCLREKDWTQPVQPHQRQPQRLQPFPRCSPQAPVPGPCPAAPEGRGQVWPDLAAVCRKPLTAGLTPAMCTQREALPVPRRGLRRSWQACAPG